MSRRTSLVAGAVLLLAMLASPALAQGIVVPPDQPEWPDNVRRPERRNFGISLKRHEIAVTIQDQVATTTITQVFHNPHPHMLEGTYLFPLPDEVAIQRFRMEMNGEMVEGEILEANRARQIYQAIVRQMIDPGLLEYVGRDLIRARIFPVTPRGDTTIELTYTQLLEADSGVVKYEYPLNTSHFTDLPTDQVVVTMNVQNQTPIRSIYSPSHDVEVLREELEGEINTHAARIGYEKAGEHSNRDFQLYYTLGNDRVDLSTLSYKPAGEDGYFMMLVSPETDVDVSEVLPKDVVFVLDTSGSMRDAGKMEQARGALSYCLQSLNPQDRFGIVSFSTAARQFRDSLVVNSDDNQAAAATYVEGLRASGGTAIDEALLMAAGMIPESRGDDRIPMVVFLTDGVPTVGTRDVNQILAHTTEALPEGTRVFTLGVGNDVNTRLLDILADGTRGTGTFIDPGEDIELKVSHFYDKISSPVMANVRVEIAGAEVYDVLPRRMPDLFKGQQLVLFGRYRLAEGSEGTPTVSLHGTVQGDTFAQEWQKSFATSETGADFVPRLWAVRKVGEMMNEIRINGASEELRQEIIRLGTQFGIVTPYTSFLVTEDEELQAGRPGGRRGGFNRDFEGGGGGRDPQRQDDGNGPTSGNSAAPPAESPDAATAEADSRRDSETDADEARDGLEREAEDATEQSGEEAVDRAEALRRMRGATSAAEAAGSDGRTSAARRTIGTRTFLYLRGWWIDTGYDAANHTEADAKVEVTYGSDAYFDLLAEKPELARFFSLGRYVAVVIDDVVYISKPAPAESEEDGNADDADDETEPSDD